MSKIKDLSKDVNVMEKCLSETQKKQTTISTDLYDSIKEVAELKYRMMELEVKVSNLTDYVKTQEKKGGQ